MKKVFFSPGELLVCTVSHVHGVAARRSVSQGTIFMVIDESDWDRWWRLWSSDHEDFVYYPVEAMRTHFKKL